MALLLRRHNSSCNGSNLDRQELHVRCGWRASNIRCSSPRPYKIVSSWLLIRPLLWFVPTYVMLWSSLLLFVGDPNEWILDTALTLLSDFNTNALGGIKLRVLLQSWQNSLPHKRQWWRLLNMGSNRDWHALQWLDSVSGSHGDDRRGDESAGSGRLLLFLFDGLLWRTGVEAAVSCEASPLGVGWSAAAAEGGSFTIVGE